MPEVDTPTLPEEPKNKRVKKDITLKKEILRRNRSNTEPKPPIGNHVFSEMDNTEEEKGQLQKQLDDLKDKSKNNIVISDIDISFI